MYRNFVTAIFTILTILALATTIVTSLLSPPAGGDIARITDPDNSAFAWLRVNTPSEATWILLGEGHDFYGNVAEWFPVLTGRRALNVLQGREWLGVEGAIPVNECDNAMCIRGDEADYIYISKCCDALLSRLQRIHPPIYTGGSVTIFEGTGRGGT